MCGYVIMLKYNAVAKLRFVRPLLDESPPCLISDIVFAIGEASPDLEVALLQLHGNRCTFGPRPSQWHYHDMPLPSCKISPTITVKL